MKSHGCRALGQLTPINNPIGMFSFLSGISDMRRCKCGHLNNIRCEGTSLISSGKLSCVYTLGKRMKSLPNREDIFKLLTATVLCRRTSDIVRIVISVGTPGAPSRLKTSLDMNDADDILSRGSVYDYFMLRIVVMYQSNHNDAHRH